MAKYHITQSGVPGICRAHSRPCPLGGPESHFDSKGATEAHIKKTEMAKFGLLPETQQDPLKALEEIKAEIERVDAEIQQSYIDERKKNPTSEELTASLNLLRSRQDKLKELKMKYDLIEETHDVPTPRRITKKSLMKTKTTSEFNDSIQKIADKHKDELLEKTFKRFGVRDLDELREYDRNMTTLDCGWMIWGPKDEDLSKHISKLNKKERGYSEDRIRLRLPLPVQSTTIQGVYSDLLKDKIKDEIELYSYAHLD